MPENIKTIIHKWLIDIGISTHIAEKIIHLSDFILILLLGYALYHVSKFLINKIVRRIVARTRTEWDDVLITKKVFQRIALLIPGLLVYNSIPATLSEFPKLTSLFLLLTSIYLVIVVILIGFSFLNSIEAIFEKKATSRNHPIKGFIQVGKTFVVMLGIIVILSFLLNKSAGSVLIGLGTFSAVLLLIFRDSILGFVGGIQISANDMVRLGDWINMPKYNADGTVQEISLTTVKVQNWDNTITTLPTYSLITDSFQNYRGMQESGARRMKRFINIDMASVRFCDKKMLNNFRRISILKDYIDQTEQELDEYNSANKIDESILVNGKRQTNIGIFRAYLEIYLRNNELIRQDLDLLVRQLQPTANGIPIEIYAFTTEVKWARYEKVQSDIFDHILAIVPEFDLRVFQSPSGIDIHNAVAKIVS